MHVLGESWDEIGEFGMILAWNMNGWLIIDVGMSWACMIILRWLVRHDFWYGQDVIPLISRWDLMVVPHWSGYNSTMVVWWCLMVRT